jgi:hypothetical protein
MTTGDRSSFITRARIARGSRIRRSGVLASVGILSMATVLSTASVVEASGTAGAKVVTPPTFTKTLAGPSVANMYSSGTEWDAGNSRIVVADTGNDRVEFYSPTSGNRTGMFGTFGSGNG